MAPELCGLLQRATAKLVLGWDDEDPDWIVALLIDCCVQDDDPVKGRWDANPRGKAVVSADASSGALGAVVEVNGDVLEDRAWLRKPRDAAHLNVAELDAVVEGVNVALRWSFNRFEIKSPQRCTIG